MLWVVDLDMRTATDEVLDSWTPEAGVGAGTGICTGIWIVYVYLHLHLHLESGGNEFQHYLPTSLLTSHQG